MPAEPLSPQPFRRALSSTSDLPPVVETEFERQRGVIETEIREGFALFEVDGLTEPLSDARTSTLQRIAKAGISIDFLKLTSEGLSFVVQENLAGEVSRALEGLHITHTLGRCVVSAWSPNLRDEEGLAARLVSAVIASGAGLDHVSDMHDRLLFLMDRNGAESALHAIQGVAR